MLSEEKKLIDYVRSECKEHGIRFVLSNHQAVNTGERCRASGYFDETSLVVAKKSSKWVQTLAHEYCHMCQWLEGEPKISNIYNERIFNLLGEERKINEKISEFHMNIASSAQTVFEEIAIKIMNKLYETNPCENISLSADLSASLKSLRNLPPSLSQESTYYSR